MMHGVGTCSVVDAARVLVIHWVVYRNVWYQLDYREVCAHWVPKFPQMITNLIVWDCIGLPCIHWTHYTDQGEQFGAEIWLITHNLKPENGCVIEKLPSPSSKENGNIVTSKNDRGKRLGTINMCLFWISWTMVTLLIVIVVHLAYNSHFSQKTSVTSPDYCPFARKFQAPYTQLDNCLWLCI